MGVQGGHDLTPRPLGGSKSRSTLGFLIYTTGILESRFGVVLFHPPRALLWLQTGISLRIVHVERHLASTRYFRYKPKNSKKRIEVSVQCVLRKPVGQALLGGKRTLRYNRGLHEHINAEDLTFWFKAQNKGIT